MELIRSFIPVGQGAFYVERFIRETTGRQSGAKDRLTVVYDCGSLSLSEQDLTKVIEKEFIKGEEIDAVFISHFDTDHFNGLDFLSKRCRINNLIIPYLAPECRIMTALNYCVQQKELRRNVTDQQDGFFIHLILKPELEYYDRQIHKIQVAETESQTLPENAHPNGEDLLNTIACEKQWLQRLWHYVPFNFRHNSRFKDFKVKLKAQFLPNALPDDLANMLSFKDGGMDSHSFIKAFNDNKETIIRAYDNVRGGKNTNSLTVYSGPVGEHGFAYLSWSSNDTEKKMAIGKVSWSRDDDYETIQLLLKTDDIRRKVGCLYLGDYEAKGGQKWNNLYQAYEANWPTIGCVQIPHHGSNANYNEGLCIKNGFAIISANPFGNFHHPHDSVIRDLVYNECHACVVTESATSRVDFFIDDVPVSDK